MVRQVQQVRVAQLGISRKASWVVVQATDCHPCRVVQGCLAFQVLQVCHLVQVVQLVQVCQECIRTFAVEAVALEFHKLVVVVGLECLHSLEDSEADKRLDAVNDDW